MKIVLTVHQFLPEFTAGTEVIALGVAQELVRRGHEVRVVTGFPAPGPLPDEQRFDSYTYEGLPVERFLHSHHAMGGQQNLVEMEYNNRLFFRFFRDLLQRERPDVVHFLHLGRLSASAIEACEELRIPMVFTATDFWLVCPLSQLRLWDNSLCGGPSPGAVNCVRHHIHLMDSYRKIKSPPPSEQAPSAEQAPWPSVLSRLKYAARLAVMGSVNRVPEWALAPLVRAIHRWPGALGSLFSEVRSMSRRPEFMAEHMNKADLVLAPSQIVQSMLLKHGLDEQRARLLPYGIDLSQIQKRVDRGAQPILRVGFVGAVSEHKGCHILVEAVRALADAPLVLDIFGSFPGGCDGLTYAERLKTLIGDDARISLRGSFEHEQIGAVFCELDLLVVPSIWYENTPVVICEALAAGCPIVATDLAGISEIVRHEENGLLFPKGDAAALARALERLTQDRALLKRLASNARPPSSLQEHVTKLEGFYQEAMAIRNSKTLA